MIILSSLFFLFSFIGYPAVPLPPLGLLPNHLVRGIPCRRVLAPQAQRKAFGTQGQEDAQPIVIGQQRGAQPRLVKAGQVWQRKQRGIICWFNNNELEEEVFSKRKLFGDVRNGQVLAS